MFCFCWRCCCFRNFFLSNFYFCIFSVRILIFFCSFLSNESFISGYWIVGFLFFMINNNILNRIIFWVIFFRIFMLGIFRFFIECFSYKFFVFFGVGVGGELLRKLIGSKRFLCRVWIWFLLFFFWIVKIGMFLFGWVMIV